MMIITSGSKYNEFIVIVWIVIHLGRNPRNGGNPPNDIKFRIKKIFNVVLLFIEVNNCLMLKVFVLLTIRIMFSVIVEYTMK